MVLFIYGEENYLSAQKLLAIKNKYIGSNFCDTNLEQLDFGADKINPNQLARLMLAMPFLAKTRLVIIKNILAKGAKKTQEKMQELLKMIPKSTIAVFYEKDKFDKRLALFKVLKKSASTQEFNKLDPNGLKKWIKKEIQKYEIDFTKHKINEAQLSDMLLEGNNDLWQLENLINVIALYLTDQTKDACREDLEFFMRQKLEDNIFNLVEAIAQKNTTFAMKKLHDLLDSKVNELYIFSMIVYQFRNILIVKELKDRQINITQTAQKAHINPYVLIKSQRFCERYSMAALKQIYLALLSEDIKIKSGQINSTLALDLLIAKICYN